MAARKARFLYEPARYAEVDAEHGSDAHVGQPAAGAEAVDGLAIHAEPLRRLLRRHEIVQH